MRSGRRMNRKDRDRGGEMRLTERTRKLIPEIRRGVLKGAIGSAYLLNCTPGNVSTNTVIVIPSQ